MRDEILKRLDELMNEANQMLDPGDSQGYFAQQWAPLRAELATEQCENCQLWDSDPSSAPEVEIPEKTYARVCFGLTLQDVWSGDFMAVGGKSVLTKADFHCSHFDKKEKL